MPVETRDLWNEWVEPFDLFISYARKNNENGMISALIERIEADFAQFSPSVPLKVFFDKKSILDMQHWQNVLKKGLRQSKVMLAVLSEAYFNSEWCRREWEEYIRVEQARTYPGEALTPIFIVSPEELSKVVPAAAQDWWNDVSTRNAVVEIHPFWPKGRSALQEQLVVERLRQLEENIRNRVEYGQVLAKVPRDIRGRNPNFVGRKQELARIRDALTQFEMVGICAVNGVGGIGKSSVAREYAYLFRREYLGGQFEIDLSSISSIRGVLDQLVRIARNYLAAAIPPELPEAEQHARARATFQQLPPGQTALLILDNLNEDVTEIVGEFNRDALPSSEKVHILVTTRADPSELGGITTVAVDCLPVEEALDLLFRYRAFARPHDDPAYLAARAGNYPLTELEQLPGDEEWKAALAIVHRLGRHTLALTLVAGYLGIDRGVSYAKFHQQLAQLGIGLALDKIGSVKAVRNLVKHPNTLIGPLFERSIVRVSRLALRTLEYAAFMAADLVPIAWLEQLVSQDADMANEFQESIGSPPWDKTLAELDGLQYLIGRPYGRMHRVLQDVVRRRMSDVDRRGREEVVVRFIEKRTLRILEHYGADTDVDEISSAEQFVRARSNQSDPWIGLTGLWLVSTLQNIGQLRKATEIALFSHRILKEVLTTDPTSAEKQHNLALSLNKLGNVSMAADDLAGERNYYEQSLAIRRTLADANPHSVEKQCYLAIAIRKLGDVSVAAGDLAAARDYYQQYLAVIRPLRDADLSLPPKLTDPSIRFDFLGDKSVAAGDLLGARADYEQCLAIRKRVAAAHPDSAQKQRDLGVSHFKLFDVENSLENRSEARAHLAAYVSIWRKLEAEDRLPSPNDRAELEHYRRLLDEWAS
jgi:tetratricopeptide (TPR) repeat protein